MPSRVIFNRALAPIASGTFRRVVTVVLAAAVAGACSDPNRPNLNNPSQNDFTTITDRGQVQSIVIGLFTGDRGVADNEILDGETLGRDLYNITNSEPRFITELLGPADRGLDPSGFLGGSIWPYDNIHLADIAVHGIDAADAAVLSDGQKAGAKGVIRTLKALGYIRAIETRDTTGIPIDTDLPDLQVAPISCKADALNYIAALLDSAAADLTTTGAEFTFSVPQGFADFADPASFLQFNRALAAKVNIYRGFENFATAGAAGIDQAALTLAVNQLDSSYIDTTDASALDFGPQHTYSTIAGDATNPLFEDPDNALIRANPRVASEADANDQRVARKITKGKSRTGDPNGTPVSSDLIFNVYPSSTSPIPVLPNKQLIVMLAEAEWGLGEYTDALSLSNFLRTADGGLAAAPASVASQPDSLLTEILKQERYSLLFESAARWIDARMFGRLDGEPPAGLGAERGNQPIAAFPLPQSELDARPDGITKQCSAG